MGMVFVPATRSDLAHLAKGERIARGEAYRATEALAQALGLGPDQTEEAEHAAMLLASVAALARHGERVVVAAELPEDSIGPGDDPDNGRVEIGDCPAAAVRCFFTDEPRADVAACAREARGLDLDAAWELPRVRRLLAEADLLWHDATEIGL